MKRIVLLCLVLLGFTFSMSAGIPEMLESQCAVTFDGIMQRQFIKELPEFDAVVTDLGDPNDGRTVYVTLAEDGRTLKLMFDAQTLYVTNLKPFNVLKRKSVK